MKTEHDLVIIKGKREGGNTAITKSLVSDKDTIWTTPKYFMASIRCITESTEYLVIQEVTTQKDIDLLIPFLREKEVIVRTRQGSKTIKLPKLIICVLCDYNRLLNLDNMNILVKTISQNTI